MAHQTEAACLLDSGAIYWKRAGMHPGEGDPIFAGFKRGAFSLYFGDAPIYHFDLEGRWQRTWSSSAGRWAWLSRASLTTSCGRPPSA